MTVSRGVLSLAVIVACGSTGLAANSAAAQSLLFRHDSQVALFEAAALSDVRSTSECLAVTTDTVLESDVSCIDVADDVTLDLNGFTVHGSIVQLETGDNVHVLNGTVAGGMILLLGRDVRIDRIELVDSEFTFAVQIGRGEITRSKFVGNVVAIDLFWGGGIRVERCRFSENLIGVSIQSDDDSRIVGNKFEANEIGVNIFDEDLVGSSGSVVKYNYFRDNGVGVRVIAFNEVHDSRIEANAFVRNDSSGVALGIGCAREFSAEDCAGRATLVRRNVFVSNGNNSTELAGSWLLPDGEEPFRVKVDDGLTVFAATIAADDLDVEVARNWAFRNADLGLEAPGVTDGGRNRAFGNGNSDECVGVECGPPWRHERSASR